MTTTVTRSAVRVPIDRNSDSVALLRSIALFADLAPAEVRELAAATHRRAIKRGAMIFEQDALGETAFILLSGEVDIVSDSADGRELLLARLAPGEIFGEMSLLDSEPRSASAIARQDSDVFVISRGQLLAQLERHPTIMLRLLQSLSRRLRRANERLNAFAFRDVACRLAGTLLTLVGRDGEATILMDQQQLADQVGAARQTVSRILNNWRRQGMVDTQRGRIRVLDLEGLRRLGI